MTPANTIMWLINQAVNKCKWNTTVAHVGRIKQLNVNTNLIHEDVFLVFLCTLPFAINQKHIASLGFTGPALWSAMLRNVSTLAMSSSQLSTCRHEHAILLRLEERRGERVLEEWGVIWDNPVNALSHVLLAELRSCKTHLQEVQLLWSTSQDNQHQV